MSRAAWPGQVDVSTTVSLAASTRTVPAPPLPMARGECGVHRIDTPCEEQAVVIERGVFDLVQRLAGSGNPRLGVLDHLQTVLRIPEPRELNREHVTRLLADAAACLLRLPPAPPRHIMCGVWFTRRVTVST